MHLPVAQIPCKHGLALLWMFTDDAAAFAQAAIPDWVTAWQGRRRKSTAPPPVTADAGPIIIAQTAPPDPEAEARRLALAQKRAADTRRSVHAATLDLDTWISDQLAGLPAFLADPAKSCRKIAARLVDAKAAALASRLDELPSRLLAMPGPERPDAAIAELGKLVLLVHAWRAAPRSPDLRRELLTAESRGDVLADPTAPRVASAWEVLGERIVTRRDGLVGVSTWLLNLRPSRHQFALLADYFSAISLWVNLWVDSDVMARLVERSSTLKVRNAVAGIHADGNNARRPEDRFGCLDPCALDQPGAAW